MTIREIDDSQLVGAPVKVAEELVVGRLGAGGGDVCMVDVEVRSCEGGVAKMLTSAAGDVTGKRKRGRPLRGRPRVAPPPSQQMQKQDEEDVCFICFDGGSLVLCDRRGCPKAYHPACIKRDEAFFRSKAKWNCGWHICSTCQKASHYMCYTCTYSLCKRCTKNADYMCVRENKGFCGTCMRTVMLIEKIAVGHNEMIQVDFDDKTSWEYLFKVYWICLKNKLSLTLDELIKAKNPWNVDELPKARNLWRGTNAIAPKGIPISEVHHCNDEKGSKVNNQPVLVDKGNSVVIESSALDKTAYLALEGTAWATKELMEFIAHMKNGDVSVLSQFDVQALLLEYIKRNKLRDPRQKSLIVCDSRLISLFGKARVGHFEMLNLLKCHFLIKEKPSVEETVRAEAAEKNGTQVILNNDRRRKPRRKTDEGGTLINANPDECAAIDVHNINLLYLKRSLVENLLDDAENFPEKVVGSFVRIKISGGDQKIEAYRLVQVVGTTKVAESYTVGTRMTDFMLEILNLDKKEIVSIDGISNQEFSEDECRHLRQSIKCGLNKRLTVGEILGKAMMLLAVKVGDGLEAEKLLLNHLCDRASEKGQRKQLRDSAEKLELLKSPKELQQRLLEIPKIHADPKLDPSYESDEYPREGVGKKLGGHARPRNSGRGRKGIQAHCMLSSNILSDTGNRGHSSNSQKTKVGVSAQITSEQNIQSVVQSETSSGIASAILPPTASTGVEIFANDLENERLWHYQDPTGKVQGPFAMRLLRRWSLNGLFPLDLRVWKINKKQDDSVLLTDALVGRLHKEPALPQEVFGASTNNDKGWENGLYMDQSTDTTWADSKNVESSSKSAQSCANFRDNSNSELMSTIFGSDSPSWTTSVTVTPLENGQVQSSVHGLDASKSSKSWTDQPQKCSNSSSPPSAGKFCETPSPQVRKDHGDEKLSTDLGDVKDDFIRTAEGQSNLVANEEKRAESEVYSSHSPGQNWGPLALNSSSSSGWASNSGIVSESKSVEKLKQHKGIDFSDLPRPTPKFSEEGIKGQPAESKPPASSSVPTLDSGPSWSTASSLVVGGAQLPEVVGEWYGYSSAPMKPSVDEWDSNVVPASSLKPATEVASDHVATPTSGSVQLTQCSETHLTIDADDWQPIVTEGPENEFSLVDESVSDLLAEVEAMESMGGLSSPTSRMNCSGELTQGSDNNCFAPVEEFSPVPDQGKNDALSSTGDMQIPSHLAVAHEQPPQLSHMPSQPAVSEALVIPQMPSRLHLANEPLRVSHLPSQATLVDELGTSHMHCQSNVTNGPVELPETDAFDPHKSFGAPSSNSAEVDRDTKPVDGSGNQWDSGSEVQPLESSHFPQGKTGLDSHQSAESHTDAYLGSTKVNANLNRGLAAKGTANMIWGGPGHGTVQHQASLNTTNSIGNPGSWGSHNPRNGGERSSGARDHRNYYQGRDSGFGRDSRSAWNRQPLLGVGNGGHTFRAPPKGQRVCKYYESGYCRKGASCSYWHPGA